VRRAAMAVGEVYDFKSVGVKRDDPRFTRDVQLTPIGITTPLSLESQISGPFKMHFTLADQIHDNLKNLILTNHGDRLGRYNVGANLKELCSELSSKRSFDSEAMIRVKSAVAQNMSYVELSTFESTFNDDSYSASKPSGMSLFSIKITYNVPRLKIGNRALEVILFIMG